MLFSYLFFIVTALFLIAICFRKFRHIFYKPYPRAIKQLNEIEFYDQFEQVMPVNQSARTERWKELIEKAWKVRDFEIELYWKRANYFWLFQVPAFGGYFLINKNSISGELSAKPDELFVITCLGITFSTAWFLINKGSKAWQRHWEEYIDLLERKYYGPFYQTVSTDRTYSVSKINEIISSAFIGVWILFAFQFLSSEGYFETYSNDISTLNPMIAFSAFFTILAIVSMKFGFGRGYFGERRIRMYSRNHRFVNP
ncbi:hypothetical protein [Pedobacter sp. SYSU D00535]|uniref:RipA family octameric membrane protein n=1 Tax=Pedobacter sp. SYSU D00535 TaxID=2810308 RepID=UPI001A9625CE|nr:hypothetical protein [Pedobacter sp. SYSU D00535]